MTLEPLEPVIFTTVAELMVGPVYCSVSAAAPPVQSSVSGGLGATHAVNWTLKRQGSDAHSIRLEH